MYLVQARIQGQVTVVTCESMQDDLLFPGKVTLKGCRSFVVGESFIAKSVSIPKSDVLFHAEGGIIPAAASVPPPPALPQEAALQEAAAQSNGNKPGVEKGAETAKKSTAKK